MSSNESGNRNAEASKRYRPNEAIRALLPKLNVAKPMKQKGKADGHNHQVFIANKLDRVEKLFERRTVIKGLLGILRNNISNLETGMGRSANATMMTQLNHNLLDLVNEAQFSCLECKKLFKKLMALKMVEKIRGDSSRVYPPAL